MRTPLRNTLLLAGLVLGLGSASTASATLLNLPMTFPLLSYDNGGHTSYDAMTDAFRVDAFPIAIRLSAASSPRFITPVPQSIEAFTIAIEVDDAGNLTGGSAGDDLSIIGSVVLDGMTKTGTLLTGEIVGGGFGWQNNAATDLFDFQFVVTGGELASYFNEIIGVTLQSERSTFNGEFAESFRGGAKGTLGNVPEPASLVLVAAGVFGLGALGRKRN